MVSSHNLITEKYEAAKSVQTKHTVCTKLPKVVGSQILIAEYYNIAKCSQTKKILQDCQK